MEKYNFSKIEKYWQKVWDEEGLNKADDNSKKPKFYCLDMFPYPSGAGLHVGHVESYTATDIYSRFMRMNGYNVLHPQGWDAFGLPAENYAIKTGVHPKITTEKAIKNFKRQINSLGFSYDWSREINTSDPSYYKWTQWLFLELYKNGLAYQKKAPVNWCKSCQTVLAREQVVNGACERCGKQVVQKELKQWFFKITDYAEKLLDDLKGLDWPEKIKKMQENWIGRSEGALIKFKLIANSKLPIANVEVFTTRSDTIFGATYMVLAPEHNLINNLISKIKNWDEVENYIDKTQKKTELERTSLEKTKTGIELKGIKAINPATKKEIPVFIADYVLTTYGTGAIMAVPAHDKRDWDFAKFYHIPIKYVIKPKNISDFKLKSVTKDTGESMLAGDILTYRVGSETIQQAFNKRIDEIINSEANFAYIGNGELINSAKFDGMDSEKAKDEIIKLVGGKKSTQYKLRDWLISRQRYWGAPIPIIYCNKCGVVPVPEEDLPVELPDDVDFRPTGESPLARSKKFQNVKCPKCHSPARRESDTMDTFVDSSWYFLRYADSNDKKQFASSKMLKKWLPVDLYVGGAEHAVMHLMYARFITKALLDMKYIDFNEPFLKLKNQGIILAPDGRKMSKSLGNVINPDDIVKNSGADVLRIYEMFMGPLEDEKPWNTEAINGIERFLNRIEIANHKYIEEGKNRNSDSKSINVAIKNVTNDIKSLKFNTAISSLMILFNGERGKPDWRSRVDIPSNELWIDWDVMKKFLIILSPFAPHLAEELWRELGHKDSIFLEKWPEYKEIKEEKGVVVIQINGKVRAKLDVPSSIDEKSLLELAKKNDNISRYLTNKKIKKTIYISGKILSIVV